MSVDRPILMIPGPIEISPTVREAFGTAPPSHLAPLLIEAFGSSLQAMRTVWKSDERAQPFVVGGGGTLAMDMAVCNLIEPGDRAVLINTGYFSDRLAEMLQRQGAELHQVRAAVGDAPLEHELRSALGGKPVKAVFATHVDTSTGVRVDPSWIAALAREHGALSVFDGVCATAAERFDMAGWDADVYLTGSQKAIGLPAGLALMVASSRAMTTRETRRAAAPPMALDWLLWCPVMQAYEARKPSYFSTPPTNGILALRVGLDEILHDGLEARLELHRRVGAAMRAAWNALGLQLVPLSDAITANTLSAIRYPSGVDSTLPARIADAGVIVAGGLHPAIRDRYFRVGHMGYAATRPELLLRTIRAVGAGLAAGGHAADVGVAETVAREILDGAGVP